jgi:hypothetical protein
VYISVECLFSFFYVCMTIKKADMRERVRKGFLNISMDTIEQEDFFCRMYAFDSTSKLKDAKRRKSVRARVYLFILSFLS